MIFFILKICIFNFWKVRKSGSTKHTFLKGRSQLAGMACSLLSFFRAYFLQFPMLPTTPYSTPPGCLSAHCCYLSAHHRHWSWQLRAVWLPGQDLSTRHVYNSHCIFASCVPFCLWWVISLPLESCPNPATPQGQLTHSLVKPSRAALGGRFSSP